MPRIKDEIWKQFNEVTLANGTIRAECKGCKASIVGLVSRMKTHFEACSKKRAAPQNTTDDEPTPKQTKQSTLPFLTSGTKQHAIHLQIARCIIATGSAFRSVENKQFKNMVQLLRPGTVLPTRQLVSGTLLDGIYDIEKAKVSSLVTGLEGTLLVDGWSDLTNHWHPVIGVAFVTNGQGYLVTTVDSPGAFPQVMFYMAKEAPFSSNLFGKDYENISATSWWKTGRRLGFPDDLVNVALPLVAAASSSAGLERQFSTMGFTYGTLRAQLGVEKAGKIAFLYRELNK